MTYHETLNYLFSRLPMFQRIGAAAYKANLDNTWALMKELNEPYKKFKSIHIAGTNGKGSSSHMLASVLQSAGYKVGLYTSPHLKDFRERIRINGQMIPEKRVIDFVEKHKASFERIESSFFEWTVALAFDYFANAQVDIAVIEVGLGGRLDSTNVITPEVSLITNIGWDHMNLLGDTLEKIAGEKAGIIKPHVPVIISETHPKTEKVFINKANFENAPISFADQLLTVRLLERNNFTQMFIVDGLDWKNFKIELDLPGTYQQQNIKGVLATIANLREQGWKINDSSICEGLSSVKDKTGLLGRWQVIKQKPLVIADTGHNKNGIAEVLANIQLTPHKNLFMVWGMVNDKAIDDILAMLPKDAKYFFCKPDIPRGLDAKFLQEQASTFELYGEAFESVASALAAAVAAANAETDLIFVGGSTFVVAEVV